MWTFGITTLTGTPIGAIDNAFDRRLNLSLNGLPTASFRVRLDNPVAAEIEAHDYDVLCKVYQDSTLRFVGELTTAEALGPGYKRMIDRQGLLNVAYSLPSGFPDDTDVRVSEDATSQTDRGLFEEVIPSDVEDTQLRQALIDAHVDVRKVYRQIITFERSDDRPNSLACNFAGPLWRLQKRMADTNTAVGLTTSGDIADIIYARLAYANAIRDTGIREGTSDTFYSTSVGPWRYKPVAEIVTELQAAKVPFPIVSPPVPYLAVDAFGDSGGSTLSGLTDDSSNTWGGSGDAQDFVITANQAYRDAVSDTTARFGQNGYSTIPADALFGVDFNSGAAGASGHTLFGGLYCRASGFTGTGSSPVNYLFASVDLNANLVFLDKVVAGAITRLGSATVTAGILASNNYTFRLLVTEQGNYTLWFYKLADGIGPPTVLGRDPVLATAGALASGRAGIIDALTSAGPLGRAYDNYFIRAYPGPQSFDFEIEPVEPIADSPPPIVNGVKLGEMNIQAQIGTSKPGVIFEFGPDAGTPPSFGDAADEWNVGDYVTGRALEPDGNVPFNATFRIYGAEIVPDDEGKADENPTLVPE